MRGRLAARRDGERARRRRDARDRDVGEHGEQGGEFATDPEGVARAICLRLLTGAPRTRAQLAEALRRRGVPDDAAERVLDRLVDVRLVDDGAFAEAWVDTRHRGRGLARRALRAELRQRGVDDELVGTAVARIDDDDEAAAAAGLVARKLGSTRGLPYDARVRRLAGMLARKGYSGGLALRVVRDALRREQLSDEESASLANGWEATVEDEPEDEDN
jgi:regulatory protein